MGGNLWLYEEYTYTNQRRHPKIDNYQNPRNVCFSVSLPRYELVEAICVHFCHVQVGGDEDEPDNQ